MKNTTIKFICFALCASNSAAIAESECKYSFKKNGGDLYKEGDVVDFVKNEIRRELKNNDSSLEIEISQSCGNKTIAKKISLSISTKNYYIIGINGKKLPEHIVDYNNRLALDINRLNFDKFVRETNDHDFLKFSTVESVKTYADRKELLKQQRILKMYAFVFAEAARFESAEQAVKNTIDGNCSIDWHDFDYAVHNWANISDFITKENLIRNDQVKGGGNSQLIAPITIEQENKFDQALMSGKDYKYSKPAPFIEQYEYECKCNYQ